MFKGIPLDASLRGYDAKWVSDSLGTVTGEESLVQQHLADEVDINTIMRRFGATGLMPSFREGVYADFTGITDFESAVQTVAEVNARFMRLPAEMRAKFENNPAMLVNMVQDMSEDEFNEFNKPEPEAQAVVAPVEPKAPVAPPDQGA